MARRGATFAKVRSDITKGTIAPLYLVVGEERFQQSEILEALKAQLIPDLESRDFNLAVWDGVEHSVEQLRDSLDTLPSLFDAPGAKRLVICHRFDRMAGTDQVASYFEAPPDDACFVMICSKVDGRKAWVKKAEQHGVRLELNEPYDRDWPRWKEYFEKRSKVQISPEGWQLLVEGSGRSLAIAWAEWTKLLTYADSKSISVEQVMEVVSGGGEANVFNFVGDVVQRKSRRVMKQYHQLLQQGENALKLQSLLVRQYRMVENCLIAQSEGIHDNRALAGKVGIHPFFLAQVLDQAARHDRGTINEALRILAESDFRMKVGEGGFFEGALLPLLSLAQS